MTSTDTLSCLSVLQPWAWLITQGYKPVENRTWRTAYRGRLLIQAGKAYDAAEHESARQYLIEYFGIKLPRYEEMPRGAIVGEVVVTDCVTMHPSPFFMGPFGLVMAAPQAYATPIPYRGQLGIFKVPASTLDWTAPAHPPTAASAPAPDAPEGPHQWSLL